MTIVQKIVCTDGEETKRITLHYLQMIKAREREKVKKNSEKIADIIFKKIIHSF